jgi:hypothetical protein
VRVVIDHAKFWSLAAMHPVHMNIRVLTELRAAGIPVDGGLELRGVTHGRLTMFNEKRDGKRHCVYEWTPGLDSVQAAIDEDDEL